jgi:hypothetical protein
MNKKRQTESAEELLLANVAELDALVELLVRKGVITKAELLDEIRAMKQRRYLALPRIKLVATFQAR